MPASQTEHVASAVAPSVLEYLPGAQSLHCAGPVSALYLPATHIVHGPPSRPEDPLLQVQADLDTLATGETEFVGHASHLPAPRYWPAAQYLKHGPPLGPLKPLLHTQLLVALLPGGDSEFGGQLKHVEAPMVFLYFPATHRKQVCPSAPEDPILHLHAVFEELPSGEFELVGHVKQLPLWLYCPAEQLTVSEHGPPFGPVKPVLHLQFVTALLPGGAKEWGGQLAHSAAPAADEYVSAPQALQVCVPTPVLYLPATHSAHAPTAWMSRVEGITFVSPPPHMQQADC